jgi:hypothetical protein
MAKLRINGDSSGYVDLEAPNAASSSTLDLDQVPQKNATTTGFTGNMGVGISTPSTTDGGYDGGNLHVHNSGTGSSLRLTNSTTGTGTSSGMLISKWSDSNTYLTNFDNGANTIFTQSNSSGTLQTTMKLHSDGYVTKPQQPAFGIESSYGYSATATGEQVFNSSTVYYNQTNIRANIGSHWSSSTGRFTAPVAGNYSFTFNVDIKSHNSGYLLIRIRKNGSQMVGIYPDQTSSKERVTLNTVLTLATGDYIDVSWNNNYAPLDFSYASFSGFLIG